MMNKYEIAFKEIKLQEAPGALEKIKGMGYASAPVVMAGESHWSGFRPDKIQSLAA
jgi:glutaredoxin-like protein NrdH